MFKNESSPYFVRSRVRRFGFQYVVSAAQHNHVSEVVAQTQDPERRQRQNFRFNFRPDHRVVVVKKSTRTMYVFVCFYFL